MPEMTIPLIFGALNLFSGIFATLLGFKVLQKNKTGYHKNLSLLFFSVALWNISIVFETFSKTIETHIFWSVLSYPGVMSSPVFMFLFLYQYTHANVSFSRKKILLLFVLPVLTVLFVCIPGLRPIVWKTTELNDTPWGNISHFTHGWWFYIIVVYIYTLISTGVFYIIRGLAIIPERFGNRLRIILFISLIPFVFNFIYLLNSNRFYGFDLTPVSILLSTSLFFYAVTKHELLSFTPIDWNAVIDNIKDRIIVYTPDNNIIETNFSNDSILGKFEKIEEKIISLDVFFAEWPDLLEFIKNDEIDEGEFQFKEKSFKVTKNSIRNKREMLTGRVLVFNDITEIINQKVRIQEINDQLKSVNETKDVLFRIIGHDLRGPVGGLTNFLEIYIENDTPLKKEELKEFYDSTSNVYSLIENLLYWANTQSKGVDVKSEKNRINESVLNAVNAIDFQVSRKEITIINNISNEIYALHETGSLEIVLRNILSNAVKFSNKHSIIEITSQDYDDDHIRIDIKDEGVGMPKETVDDILKNTVIKSEFGTNGEKGTGLGLSLSQNIIQANRGRMQINSEVNKGTTISIFLRKA